MPLNPSEPPHLSPIVSAESGAGARATSLAFSERGEGLVEGAASMSTDLAARFLLIEDQNRLRISGSRARSSSMSMLACAFWQPRLSTVAPGNIGMVNIAGEQAAESLRILACAAAAALMGEEANAVEVGKDALGLCLSAVVGAQLVAAGMTLDELAHVTAVAVVGDAVAKLFFKGFAHPLDVAVFAEDEGQHNPVVARAHLAVGAAIAVEGACGPGAGIGQRTGHWMALCSVVAYAVADGACGDAGRRAE